MPYIGRSGWNTLRLAGAIPDEDLLEAVDASYAAVVAKLPRKDRRRARCPRSAELRAVHCRRPSSPSSRSATAVVRRPRVTVAATSATPSAGSVTCTDRTAARVGGSVPAGRGSIGRVMTGTSAVTSS